MLGENHVLINKIWDVKAQTYTGEDAVRNALLQADYIILGESHDNPVHHRLQNWALEQLIAAQQKPAVAFEMIDEQQFQAVDFGTISNANSLFDALNWEKSGWPTRELYKPLFDTVVQNDLPIASANLPRETLKDAISKSTPPAGEIQQLLEERPLSEKEEAAMLAELEESHCHMLPKQHVAGMITGQRVRDATMALSLLKQDSQPAVLIAGKGHGRIDRGAPSFVQLRQPDAKIISIGWHEVQKDRPHPHDYRNIWHTEELPFHYVWFTARVDRPDPCEEIRRFLNKKKDKKS